MLAILAEDKTDAEVLTHLVRRHLRNDSMPVKTKGYQGCGKLRSKGARDIKSWATRGVEYFVICHDADNNPPHSIREEILDAVVRPSGATHEQCCIVVPVQEIEAWLIADEKAITAVIETFSPKAHPNPESIREPKEWLIKESRAQKNKPLYSPTTFNASVAKLLRLDIVKTKCPSFAQFLSDLDGLHL